MRVAVLGGAGFIGSHLCARLLSLGHEVVVYDDLSTGRRENVPQGAHLVVCDLSHRMGMNAEWVFNLASPTGPRRVIGIPIKTIMTNIQACRSALESGARVIQASTAEIYGEPEVHPQPESYAGNVDPTGLRSCYDEGKRVAEAICMAYRRERNTDVRIARLFNTYGPGMSESDGRVVPNFVTQALKGWPITVYGDGAQIRSLCYVSDTVEALIRMANMRVQMPVNIGNPEPVSVIELARLIREMTGSDSEIVFEPQTIPDTQRRCPDISRAAKLLLWRPSVSLREGLARTIEHFEREMNAGRVPCNAVL